jgi:predicted dienelactone hydrolase
LLGIAKAGVDYGKKDDHTPLVLFRHVRKVVMDVVYYGDLSKDFISFPSPKPLTPIIFCHGLSSNRTMHSVTCRDFASHGYIVFALDYHDGTSSYI